MPTAFFIGLLWSFYVKIQALITTNHMLKAVEYLFFGFLIFIMHIILLKRRSVLKMIKKLGYRKVRGWNFNFYT